jgi:hypothetical protein
MDIVVRSFCKRAVLKTLGCDLPLFVSHELLTGFQLQLEVNVSSMRCWVRSILVRDCRTQKLLHYLQLKLTSLFFVQTAYRIQ